jgi:hypothetical protein
VTDVDDLVAHAALRRVVERYAHGVDRREPHAVAALFTKDGSLEIYQGDPGTIEPQRVRHGREEIATALEGLDRYEVTTHFLGQQSIDLDGNRATGETYCVAHHLYDADGVRRDHVLSIRYLDEFRCEDGEWLIARRRLAIDWSDERIVTEP